MAANTEPEEIEMAKSTDAKIQAYQNQNGTGRLTARQQARIAKSSKQDLGRAYPETKKK